LRKKIAAEGRETGTERLPIAKADLSSQGFLVGYEGGKCKYVRKGENVGILSIGKKGKKEAFGRRNPYIIHLRKDQMLPLPAEEGRSPERMG